MTSVLVVYGSRHGGTRGIAERIGEVLRADGLATSVTATDSVSGVGDADAIIVGSGVYMGSWLKEAVAFLERNQAALAGRAVWLFSSGPLRGSSGEKDGADPLADALGPEEGPGSGGRRKLAELSATIHPREHRVFYGAFDPSQAPRALSERLVRMMPASKGLLPPGDFREWDEIEAWAREISASLRSPVASA